MTTFDIYVLLIFLVKILFILLALYSRYKKHSDPSNTAVIDKVEFWKERAEFVFAMLMSVALIYLFNPRVNRLNLLTTEVKLLLYLFGFVLLITANWEGFIHNSMSQYFI